MGLLPKIEVCADVRFGGDNGEGDRGDFGDELGDFVTRRNFDGDRERERRSVLTAELTSTRCTCVGDGKVNVPPPLFEYDMIWRNAMTLCGSFQPRDWGELELNEATYQLYSIKIGGRMPRKRRDFVSHTISGFVPSEDMPIFEIWVVTCEESRSVL